MAAPTCGLLSAENVEEIARVAFRDAAVHVEKYSVRKRSEERFGFLGDHLTLAVRAVQGGHVVCREFFIKTYAVPSGNDVDFIGATGMFEKEVQLYEKILSKFRAWAECCPEYYLSRDRVLVLEDLSALGFRMKEGGYTLDEPHLILALRALASLHASSIIVEEKENISLDQKYPSCFREVLYNEENRDSPSAMWKERQIRDLVAGVDFLGKFSVQEKEKIKKSLPEVMYNIYGLNKKSERWRNVLVHGDTWNNNLLFRYEDGEPADCRMVDFQFSRYAPPMHDVMHLLHLNADKAFRDKHEDNLLEIYHNFLGEILAVNSLNIEHYYPMSKFLESRKTQEDSKFSNWPTEEVEKYLTTTREDTVRKYFQDEAYTKRVGGILCQLIDDYGLHEDCGTSALDALHLKK